MPAMQPRGWLLVAVFAPALVALAQVWARVDYQSRGFLIPVVAGLLTYVVACGLMLALGALLQRLERPG